MCRVERGSACVACIKKSAGVAGSTGRPETPPRDACTVDSWSGTLVQPLLPASRQTLFPTTTPPPTHAPQAAGVPASQRPGPSVPALCHRSLFLLD